LRLERLQRDAGMGAGYPEVLAWLEEAGRADDRIRVLALRRRAEKTARDGDARRAAELADEAIALADRLGDGPLRAFARATSGLVALMRASYVEAERTLAEAQALLGDAAADDPEEVARMDHNTGVVAIYRGRIDEAVRTFQRALATKRRLGDRAGMRSCLMNLGIALGKADRHDEARAALGEAMGLARSLGQTAGLGWCLSALADIEIRRRDARAAERWLASAAALSSSLPAAIQADLVLASAHVALLDGDGARAGELLAAVDRSVRASDPLVDARTFAALAEARLATLPPDPREAARCAVRAARRARAARLDEVEAQALSILRAARGRSILAPVKPEAAPSPAEDDALWTWLAALAAGGAQATGGGAQGTGGAEDPLVDLARAIVKIAGAERVLVAHVSAAGRLLAAWGADVEGFAIAEAEKRLAPEAIDRALRQAGPLYERDLATAAGRGSRLSARRETPGGAALVVAEHRFRPSAFDAVTAAQAERWATLAALALRTRAPAAGDAPAVAPSPQNARAAAEAPPPPEPPGPDWKAAASPATTTAVPLLEPRRAFPAILGESLALRRALARLDAAIDSDLPVLVTGETGTGKELFARALHEHGPRRDRELVALNCGSVPDALFEAELFGHARGSFTGADRARPGLLARAEGGTLFLDELGELPLGKQAVLLRALESRRYRPVGSDEERPFDVRVVAATNRDLERAAMEGAFRQDLLYRVNAIALTAPPLRARGGDVPLLLRAFAARVSPALEWSDRAEAALAAYAWPGNVRELLHTVERLAALRVPRVELAHLPRAIRAALASPRSAVASPRPASAAPAAPGPARRHASTEEQRTAADEEQREEIRSALRATGGNISRAAERLGLTRHGLKKRMVRLAMRPEVPKNPPDPPQRTS
jgi:DNA-binding NtrC family response regulator